jgi:hypothetical protein
MVHWKILVPSERKTIEEVGEFGDEATPLPETKDHAPVPTVGVFAAIAVTDVAGLQIDMLGPALETVGKLSRTIATVEFEAAHTPFTILHLKTLIPTPNPVIVVLGEVGEVIVPAPEINNQLPVPTVGVFAFIVAVVAQTV